MAIAKDGLVLYLHGATGKNSPPTTTWKDLSGNNNNATLYNFAYNENSGWTGNGLKFDGVDDYGICYYNESLNIKEDLTIEVVLFVPENGMPCGIVKGINGSWVSNEYGLRCFDYNEYLFFISDGINLNRIRVYYNDFIGRYTHIVATTSKTEKNLKMYKNGVLSTIGQRTINNIRVVPYNIYIGMNYYPNYTNSELLYLRIYNRALTDEEILQNYEEYNNSLQNERSIVVYSNSIVSDLEFNRVGEGLRDSKIYANNIITASDRLGAGERSNIITTNNITSISDRIGIGERSNIINSNNILADFSRLGEGLRDTTLFMNDILTQALRFGLGSRNYVSYMDPIKAITTGEVLRYYSTPEDVIRYSGVHPQDLGFEENQEAELKMLIKKWLVQIKDIIDHDRNRDFFEDGNVPQGIHNIAMRMCANMIAQASFRRESTIVQVDDYAIQMVSDEIFTESIKKDLSRYPKKTRFSMFVVKGRDE